MYLSVSCWDRCNYTIQGHNEFVQYNKRNEFQVPENVVVSRLRMPFRRDPIATVEKKSTKHPRNVYINDVQRDAGAAGRKIRVRVARGFARGILMAL